MWRGEWEIEGSEESRPREKRFVEPRGQATDEDGQSLKSRLLGRSLCGRLLTKKYTI